MCFLFFSCFVISNKNEKVATQKIKEAGTFFFGIISIEDILKKAVRGTK